MNIYKISAQPAFLELVADFIINNFTSYDRLKIIMPNGFACLNLQRLLVQKQQVLILPTIVTFAGLAAEGQAIFKLPAENIGSITYLAEKLILTEIIYSYPKLQFNLNQSLKFSSHLASLFDELAYNQIAVQSIKNLPTLNQAEHWQFIYEFLIYADQAWQAKIISERKLSRAQYQINILALEVQRLQQSRDNLLLTIGITGSNLITWNFLQAISQLPNGSIILPPIADLPDQLLTAPSSSEEAPLYCLKKLLSLLSSNFSSLKPLSTNFYPKCWLDGLITEQSWLSTGPALPLAENFQYLEFDDVFQEASAISLLCQQHSNKKIALIINNQSVKDIYGNFLSKYALKFDDLLGNNLSQINASCLIIAISEILFQPFDLKKIFVLLKNPLVSNLMVRQLENIVQSLNHFVSSWHQLSHLIENVVDAEFTAWYQLTEQLLTNAVCRPQNFHHLLKTLLSIAEKFYPDIWQSYQALELAELFSELLQADWQLDIDDLTIFPELLKSLIAGTKFYNNDNDYANIVICRPADAALLKFDLVILADFSEKSWPPAAIISPWLSHHMRKELGLYASSIIFGQSLYDFYLILHNKQVIITRSSKQGSSSRLLPSSYMLKLQLLYQSLTLTKIDE